MSNGTHVGKLLLSVCNASAKSANPAIRADALKWKSTIERKLRKPVKAAKGRTASRPRRVALAA